MSSHRALTQIVVVSLILAWICQGANLYVATSGNDTTHDSWSTAYTNVQAALDAAGNNDTLYLAGHQFALTAQLVWASCTNVTIRGGYAATNDLDQPGPCDPDRWPTVLTRQSSTVSNRILLVNGVTNCMLRGIRIAGGLVRIIGGGMLVTNCSELVINECAIVSNRATHSVNFQTAYGGGVGIWSSTMTVTNCRVEFNQVTGDRYIPTRGGGLYVNSDSVVTVIDSRFRWNQSVINNISANSTADGGGIYNAGTTTVRNCLIVQNEAWHDTTTAGYQRGDGLASISGRLDVENATVVQNLGEGINRLGGTATVTNSILWANDDDVAGTVTLGFCDVEDGDQPGVRSNRSVNPLFEFGYYLQSGSPCINAGTNVNGLASGGYTTRSDGTIDSGRVDLGYHATNAADTTCLDLYVSQGGADINTGLSWGQAKRSIGAALALARDGTTVHVATGLYNTAVETFPLVIGSISDLCLQGTNGYATRVDAGNSAGVIEAKNASGLRIEGLWITGGNKAGNGGGIDLDDCSGESRITSCVVSNNKTTGSGRAGGGICIEGSSAVTVSNCLIRNNWAGTDYGCNGGGISVLNGSYAWIVDTAIATNKSTSSHTGVYGGGVYNMRSSVVLQHSMLANNRATYGAGMPNYENGDNLYSYAAGSGLTATWLENCTVAGGKEDGIKCGYGLVSITNSIVWGNGDDLVGTFSAFDLRMSNIEDGDSNGVQNCVSIDPIFTDTTYYHLESKAGHYINGYFSDGYWTNSAVTNSPMIDALDGGWAREPQPNGRRLNWGAYGDTPVASKTFLEEPGVFTGLTVYAYSATGLGTNYATLRGEILHAGGAGDPHVYACWAYTDKGTGGTSAWTHVDDLGTKALWDLYGHPITNLISGSNYTYRFHATNTFGATDWSLPETFIAIALPVVTNPNAYYVWHRKAALRGTILAENGEPPAIWFHFWPDGGSVTSIVYAGLNTGTFSQLVTNLTANQLYHYRFHASNAAGRVWSGIKDFRTHTAPMSWYVATNGCATWGTNWSTAWTDIQYALDWVETGDTVYVAGQAFDLTNDTLGWVAGASSVRMVGGYEAANDNQQPGPSDPNQWETVFHQHDPVYRVLTIQNVTNGGLEGVTITGGKVSGHGGGISFSGTKNFLLKSCIVSNNQTTGGTRYGGGIYADGSCVITVEQCRVTHNYAAVDSDVGGGGIMLAAGGKMAILNSIIATNRAYTSHSGLYGGGIRNHGAMIVRNTLFYGNRIQYGSGNETYEHGDAVYSSVGTLNLDNCTIVKNGNEGVERGSGTLTLTNCIVWANGDDIVGSGVVLAYSAVEDGDNNTTNGCIMADPSFKDAMLHDYRLLPDSPCINKGYALGWMTGSLDLDGTQRNQGGRPEMGCYESPLMAGSVFMIR